MAVSWFLLIRLAAIVSILKKVLLLSIILIRHIIFPKVVRAVFLFSYHNVSANLLPHQITVGIILFKSDETPRIQICYHLFYMSCWEQYRLRGATETVYLQFATFFTVKKVPILFPYVL